MHSARPIGVLQAFQIRLDDGLVLTWNRLSSLAAVMVEKAEAASFNGTDADADSHAGLPVPARARQRDLAPWRSRCSWRKALCAAWRLKAMAFDNRCHETADLARIAQIESANLLLAISDSARNVSWARRAACGPSIARFAALSFLWL